MVRRLNEALLGNALHIYVILNGGGKIGDEFVCDPAGYQRYFLVMTGFFRLG